MRTVDHQELNDRERILTYIITELYSTLLLGTGRAFHDLVESKGERSGISLVYFDSSLSMDNIEKGDLIMCRSSGLHPWTVGYFHEWIDKPNHVAYIRELTSDRLCQVGNDSFIKICNVRPSALRVGKERKFAAKVARALRDLRDDYFPAIYRGGIDFLPDNQCRVYIGCHIWALNRHDEPPFVVEMAWTPRMSQKAILNAVLKSGAIEWAQKKPETKTT